MSDRSGPATARAFARKGYDVAILARGEDGLDNAMTTVFSPMELTKRRRMLSGGVALAAAAALAIGLLRGSSEG